MNDINHISSFSRDDAVKLIQKCLINCIDNNPIEMEITSLMKTYAYYKKNPDCKEDNPGPNSCAEALACILHIIEDLFWVRFPDLYSFSSGLELQESESQEVYQQRLDQKYNHIISFIENLEIDEKKIFEAENIQYLDYLEDWLSFEFNELHNWWVSLELEEVIFYDTGDEKGSIPDDAEILFEIKNNEILTPDFKTKYLELVTSELKSLKEGILEFKTKTKDTVDAVEEVL